MLHTRIQLDATATFSTRAGQNGTTEVVVLDSNGDASLVIELMDKQADALRQALNGS
jgi:hypothetical protein